MCRAGRMGCSSIVDPAAGRGKEVQRMVAAAAERALYPCYHHLLVVAEQISLGNAAIGSYLIYCSYPSTP